MITVTLVIARHIIIADMGRLEIAILILMSTLILLELAIAVIGEAAGLITHIEEY